MKKIYIWILIAIAVVAVTAIVFIFFVPWGAAKSELNKTEVGQSDSLVKSGSGKMINNLDVVSGTWVSDNSGEQIRSELFFKVEGMQETIGKFNDFLITFTGGEKDEVKVAIQSSSLFTDNEYRDEHLMTSDFFDVENYPTVELTSNEIIIGDTSYIAKGELSFIGKKYPIDVPFTFVGEGKYDDGKEFAAFEGRFDFDRIKYGMKEDAAIGNVVNVWFYAELVKK